MNTILIERNSVPSFPEYHGRNRFPKLQPKGFCRGCRGPITEKNRKTWCSDACHKKYDPFFVKHEVLQRDKCCVMCGCKTINAYDWKRRYDERHEDWMRRRHATRGQREEFDHIIPHSEGGLFTVENIRLLCHDCHAKRTAEWRRSKSQRIQREANQSVLPISPCPTHQPGELTSFKADSTLKPS